MEVHFNQGWVYLIHIEINGGGLFFFLFYINFKYAHTFIFFSLFLQNFMNVRRRLLSLQASPAAASEVSDISCISYIPFLKPLCISFLISKERKINIPLILIKGKQASIHFVFNFCYIFFSIYSQQYNKEKDMLCIDMSVNTCYRTLSRGPPLTRGSRRVWGRRLNVWRTTSTPLRRGWSPSRRRLKKSWRDWRVSNER